MTESILQIKDLRKSFGDNEILKGISLDVKQGEVVVILGSSGCGKSTLLRCINGLETIQGGDILLDGKSITGSKKDFHLIRQKIGMVFQSYGWLGWAKNGEKAGTEGLAKRLEAVQIVLVEKGGAAPGSTEKTFIKK